MTTTPETGQRVGRSGSNNQRRLRAALVGTGYIADFHARAIRGVEGVELVSVCDASLRRARSFAAQWGVPVAFDSLESLLANQSLDSIHVLVPPDRHHAVVKTALESGASVLVEKPMCVSVEQADELLALARARQLRLGVNHNLLYSHAYQGLRGMVRSGSLGPLDHVTLNHLVELGHIRFGPFDSWMLSAPGNVILEIGPHLLSALLDLVGTPDEILATADRAVELPGGTHVFRRWRIRATVGRTAVDINLNFGPGFPQRTMTARGLLGSATADFDANTCTLDLRTRLSVDLDRYKRSRSLAGQLRSQARRTLGDYVLSKLKARRRGNPYQISIQDSVAAFYDSLRSDAPIDDRIDGGIGREVIKWCRRIIHAAGVEPTAAPSPSRPAARALRPSILVLGGSGFIGRELIRRLVASGYGVRAMLRSSGAALGELDRTSLEIVRGDMRDEADLKAAMIGTEFVYHLARAEAKTWEDYLQHEVEPTRLVGQACLAANVKRLIYTGTIDSYYAGTTADTITEWTPLDRNISRRNYYARAKAAGEALLMEMHRTMRLPVVIFRPGIVVGRGGNPFHWGVGMWASEGVCQVWGDGNNKLPLVLVTDVAAALVRGIQVEGIEGRSYNLIDIPLLSAREYLDELQRRCGMALTIQRVPIWRFYAADLTKWLVKLGVRHPDRHRVPSYRDWESRTQKALFDCSRARAELSWKPASDRQRMVDEGIGGSLEAWLAACR